MYLMDVHSKQKNDKVKSFTIIFVYEIVCLLWSTKAISHSETRHLQLFYLFVVLEMLKVGNGNESFTLQDYRICLDYIWWLIIIII